MPCRDERSCDHSHYHKEIQELKNIVDTLTQDLCYLCGELMEDDLLAKYASWRIHKWWEDHEKKDNARVLGAMIKYCNDNPNQTVNHLTLHFIHLADKVHEVSRYHKKWFKKRALKAVEIVNSRLNNEKERELKKQNALNKLTDEEKKLLGIKTQRTK